jgi:uncharacterized surface protein with fasciclin (FAS1) repeats
MRFIILALAGGILGSIGAPSAQTVQQAGGIAPLTTALEQRAEFSTFTRLFQASGIAGTLGESAYTVFAPTDAAFAAQPAGALDAWLDPANRDKLARLIATHVVAGTIRAEDIPEGTTPLPTVSGSTIVVVKRGGVITVGNARVEETDIKAGGGYVHAVAGLAIPEVQTN